jgi:hypothetical protein
MFSSGVVFLIILRLGIRSQRSRFSPVRRAMLSGGGAPRPH